MLGYVRLTLCLSAETPKFDVILVFLKYNSRYLYHLGPWLKARLNFLVSGWTPNEQ
jgi:hypothetical protein